ncbi:MAG: hypothetical protein ACXADB_06125 [Candidatus Hermodarchaeia archaeon]|jgi:hypothetical protein
MKFEDLPEDANLVVCNTTDMPHVKDVTVRQCQFCNRDVWLAETTKKQLGDRDYYIACQYCANPHIKNEIIAMPSDEQLMDVAKTMGLPFDEVKARMQRILDSRNQGIKWKKKAEKYEEN